MLSIFCKTRKTVQRTAYTIQFPRYGKKIRSKMQDDGTDSHVYGSRDHGNSDDVKNLGSLSEAEVQQLRIGEVATVTLSPAPVVLEAAAPIAALAVHWSMTYDQYYKAGYLSNATAVTLLEQLVADGNDAAKAYLMLYLHWFNKDKPRAEIMGAELQQYSLPRWLQSTDATEQLHAQYIMGYCCFNGLGCKEDKAQATTWYRRAADQDHAEAQYMLGYCYYSGFGVIHDYKQTVSWYRLASDQDHAYAQYMLAGCYLNGHGVPVDREQAITWYRRSAELGCSIAVSMLNSMKVSLA